MIAIAHIWPKDLSDGAVANIWIEALSDLSGEQIDAAFARLRKEFTPTSAAPFPSPGHLRAFVVGGKAMAIEHRANEAWEKWLPIVTRFHSPDIGWRGPKIPARIDHALRAAGGIGLIAECPTPDLTFRRKDFVACFIRDEELPDAFKLAPELAAPLKSLAEMKAIAAPAEPKSLPARVPTVQAETPLPPKPVVRELTQYEVDRRKEVLRRQAEDLKAKGF